MRELTAAVDGRLVILFRRLFGLAGLHPVYKFFSDGRPASPVNFPFEWFSLPQPGYETLAAVHVVMALGALGLLLNRWPRLAALLFLLSYTYVFLLEKSYYNNHYYLICLLAFLFVWLRPGPVVPLWHLWLLRFQILLVYFYGGLAKLQSDWLLGNPLRMWFPNPPWAGLALSYGGLLFDLFIPVLLLDRRTRWGAFFLTAVFHVSNYNLFSIGIFPFLMLATNVLFLDPAPAPQEPPAPQTPRREIGLLAIYVALQLLIPFRHHLYPGNVDWTGEGAYFSWRMKLLEHRGECEFYVTDPARGTVWHVFPEDELTRRQLRVMSYRPDMLMQYARHLEKKFRAEGVADPEVRARVWVSLNGREPAPLLDPVADLSKMRRAPILPPPATLPALPQLQLAFTWLGVLVTLATFRRSAHPLAQALRCVFALIYYVAGHPAWYIFAGLATMVSLVRSRNPYEVYWLVWLRCLWVVSHTEG